MKIELALAANILYREAIERLLNPPIVPSLKTFRDPAHTELAMNRIISILRAAHCRSTHHFFAIDALSRIDTAQGQRLGNILLRHHRDYLIGAKAPDTNFRDFQNHVVHVADGNWGGAPQACEKWLVQAIEHLDKRRWRKAAYACGVLSHYFTDPLMPLHTGQTPREAALHRPMEWSVCKAYGEIYSQLTQEQLSANFQLANTHDWISKAVVAGAAVAHQHYEQLIEMYDLEQGCRNPPAGLNPDSRAILSELFCIAITGWARVLSRIADSTATELPEVSLSLTSLLATIDMPLAWILRKLSDRTEQLAVQAIFEEYQSTGSVIKNLPQEVKTVSQIRALDSEHTERLVKISSEPNEPTTENSKDDTPATVAKPQDASTKLAARQLNLLAMPEEDSPVQTPAATAVASADLEHGRQGDALSGDGRLVQRPNANVVPFRRNAAIENKSLGNLGRPSSRVQLSSNLVDAPSIGPKTAKRFEKIGITSIGQFLSADVDEMVQDLETRWINASLLQDWQSQARFVCEHSCLCGYKAQLLVAVSCLSIAQLAGENGDDLHHRISELGPTSEGQRILRSSQLPTLSDVHTWISNARAQPDVRRAA